jgi:transposase
MEPIAEVLMKWAFLKTSSVIVTHRPRLACRACEKIVEAPAPEHLICIS